MSLTFPFQYFVTSKNLSKTNLEDISYIFNKNGFLKKSILELYRSEINEYIKENKIRLSNINNLILKKLSENYDTYLIHNLNPKLFFDFFIVYRNILKNNVNSINKLKNIFETLSKQNLENYNEKLSFLNPLNMDYINLLNNGNNFKLDSKFTNLYFKNNVHSVLYLNNIIDILTQGNIINLSLPSVGIIYKNLALYNGYLNKYDNLKINNFTDFIQVLIKIKDKDSAFIDNIPFKSIDIGSTIVDILFNIRGNNYSPSLKQTFKNMIDNISFDLNEIFIDNRVNNKGKNVKILKMEFIIPYKINLKKNKDDITELEQTDINKYKKLKDLIDKNNDIFTYVLKKIYHNKGEGIKIMNTKNYKNVLACYLFYIINLTSEICNLYVDKIDNILKEIIESKSEKFKFLNIKGAFDYTSLLKKSLWKFRLILWNNFYQMFLPTSFMEGNYGMKMNEFGCYIPEGSFFGDNADIIEKYPFTYSSNSDLKVIGNDINIKNFILNVKSTTDIYNKSEKLEFGGRVYDIDLMKKGILILFGYYKELELQNKFNLYIINLLYDNWKDKSIVPIEIISDVLKLNKLNKAYFENNILLKYEESVEKSVSYILNVLTIRSKLKNSKNNIDLINSEDINYLSYVIYNMRCLAIISFVKNSFINVNLKNNLLEKINGIKNKYQSILKNQI